MGAYIRLNDQEIKIYSSECEICYEDHQRTVDQTCYVIACGHMWHQGCLDRWMKTQNTCPKCRKNIIIPKPGKASPYLTHMIRCLVPALCIGTTWVAFRIHFLRTHLLSDQEPAIDKQSLIFMSLSITVGLIAGSLLFARKPIKLNSNGAELLGPFKASEIKIYQKPN